MNEITLTCATKNCNNDAQEIFQFPTEKQLALCEQCDVEVHAQMDYYLTKDTKSRLSLSESNEDIMFRDDEEDYDLDDSELEEEE